MTGEKKPSNKNILEIMEQQKIKKQVVKPIKPVPRYKLYNKMSPCHKNANIQGLLTGQNISKTPFMSRNKLKSVVSPARNTIRSKENRIGITRDIMNISTQ